MRDTRSLANAVCKSSINATTDEAKCRCGGNPYGTGVCASRPFRVVVGVARPDFGQVYGLEGVAYNPSRRVRGYTLKGFRSTQIECRANARPKRVYAASPYASRIGMHPAPSTPSAWQAAHPPPTPMRTLAPKFFVCSFTRSTFSSVA